MILQKMQVMFTIWAKVGQKQPGAALIYIGIFAPKNLDEKNNLKYQVCKNNCVPLRYETKNRKRYEESRKE